MKDEKKKITVSKKTQERHDSEWVNPIAVSINDKEGIAKMKKDHDDFKKKYNLK